MVSKYVLARIGKEGLKKLKERDDYEWKFDVDQEIADSSEAVIVSFALKAGRTVVKLIAEHTLTSEQIEGLSELNTGPIGHRAAGALVIGGLVLAAPGYIMAKGVVAVLDAVSPSLPATESEYEYNPRQDPFLFP